MFRFMIHMLHPSLYYFIVSLVYISFALVAYFITTRLLDKKRRENDHLDEVASISLGTINGAYSIILGFILFLVWGNFQAAIGTVVEENSKLGIIKENSRGLPLPIADKIQKGIAQYSKQVIEIEWPAMSQGESSIQVTQTLSDLYKIIQDYSPETYTNQTFYSAIINALNEVMEKRTQRLSMLNSPIPTAWYVFVFIAAFVIILLNSLILRRSWIQLATHILLVLVITFFITAITALSYPFSGYISVSSKLFIIK